MTSHVLVAVSALALCAGAAQAQTKLNYNLGVASDYVFRGVFQTQRNPQLFSGLDLSAGKFYAGTWASNADFGDKTDAEEASMRPGTSGRLTPSTTDCRSIFANTTPTSTASARSMARAVASLKAVF